MLRRLLKEAEEKAAKSKKEEDDLELLFDDEHSSIDTEVRKAESLNDKSKTQAKKMAQADLRVASESRMKEVDALLEDFDSCTEKCESKEEKCEKGCDGDKKCEDACFEDYNECGEGCENEEEEDDEELNEGPIGVGMPATSDVSECPCKKDEEELEEKYVPTASLKTIKKPQDKDCPPQYHQKFDYKGNPQDVCISDDQVKVEGRFNTRYPNKKINEDVEVNIPTSGDIYVAVPSPAEKEAIIWSFANQIADHVKMMIETDMNLRSVYNLDIPRKCANMRSKLVDFIVSEIERA